MKPKSGIYIHFLPEPGRVLVSHNDQTLLDVALRCDVDIDHACGASGTCGTCVVHVLQGLKDLPPRNELEAEMAQDRGFLDEERLSCQIPPVNGLTVERGNS